MAFEETNNPLIPDGSAAIGTAVTIGAVLIGVGFVIAIAVAIYRATRMANRGQNPLTLQEDIAHRAMQSKTLAPVQSLEQRLAELDDLHERGIISDDEHRSARTDALRS